MIRRWCVDKLVWPCLPSSCPPTPPAGRPPPPGGKTATCEDDDKAGYISAMMKMMEIVRQDTHPLPPRVTMRKIIRMTNDHQRHTNTNKNIPHVTMRWIIIPMILKQYTAPKQGPPHPPTPVLLARDLFCNIFGPEDGGCAFGWWVCFWMVGVLLIHFKRHFAHYACMQCIMLIDWLYFFCRLV